MRSNIITKDEARILADVLTDAKYEFNYTYRDSVREPAHLFPALKALQEKLDFHGKDQRRTGRKSMDDFTDCVKRFQAHYTNTICSE